MKNKIIAMFLCFTVLFTSFNFIKPKQAESAVFVPVLVYGTTVGGAIVKGLVAAGLTYIGNQAADYIAQNFWDSLDSTQKETLATEVSTSNTSWEISNDNWTYLRNYAQTNFNQGTQSVVDPTNRYYGVDFTNYYVDDYRLTGTNAGTVSLVYNNVTHLDRIYLKDANGEKAFYLAPYIYFEDNMRKYAIGKFDLNDVFQSIVSSASFVEATSIINTKIMGLVFGRVYDSVYKMCICLDVYDGVSGKDPYYQVASGTSYSTLDDWAHANVFGYSTQATHVYTGADVLSNPTWDFNNSTTGKREVTLPYVSGATSQQLYDSVVEGSSGKTYQDVVNEAVGSNTGGSTVDLTGTNNILTNILNWLQNLLNIIKQAIIEALTYLFVPSVGYFQNYFTDVYTGFNHSLPIVSQLYDLFSGIASATFTANPPEFVITMPEKYGGQTMTWLDLSYFDQHRTLIYNFIRFVAWYIFLRRLFRRLPSLV